MLNIQIEEESCIRCGRCVKVCPAIIFKQNNAQSEIATQHIDHCIICGQCVAVCPTDSVIHSEFPVSKVHKINKDSYAELSDLQSLVADFSSGEDRILRRATALILIHTPKNVRFGCQDSNLAYQNASLMAQSLGVGQFYTGYICAASGMSRINNPIKKLLGIEGTIHAGMALGLQTLQYPNYVDKKDIDLRKF